MTAVRPGGVSAVTPDDVHAAARRIAGRVRRTPVLEVSPALSLKLELLQHTGSFKPRGAFNRVLGAYQAGEVGEQGVVAASGGNAGLAVAYVARELGLPARIVVPETTPAVKLGHLGALGADVVRAGAATAFAALTTGGYRPERGERVVVVICGANTDPSDLA